MTREEYVALCKADQCHTQSRANSGQKYHNKYTEYFGKKGYGGINEKGVFTKKFSYGVVGHCCIGAQYHLCQGGLSAFVPKTVKWIWCTTYYAKWLKSEPAIDGYGKVKWYTDLKKAKTGDIIFKGKKGGGFTHTCVFISYKDGYVTTVDFNVSAKKDGKKYNNGFTHKRKASKYRWGIAHMPFPTLTLYKVNTESSSLNLRDKPNGKIIGKLKKGEKVYVESINDGWAYLPQYKGVCSAKYIKKA